MHRAKDPLTQGPETVKSVGKNTQPLSCRVPSNVRVVLRGLNLTKRGRVQQTARKRDTPHSQRREADGKQWRSCIMDSRRPEKLKPKRRSDRSRIWRHVQQTVYMMVSSANQLTNAKTLTTVTSTATHLRGYTRETVYCFSEDLYKKSYDRVVKEIVNQT